IGLATVLVISLWVADEQRFDTFYPGSEAVFRVITDGHFRDNKWTMPYGPAPMAEAFKTGSPHVAASTRVSRGSTSVTVRQKAHLIEQAFYVDPDVCQVFGLTMLQGTCENALCAPDQVLLSRGMADRLFGDSASGADVLFLNGETPLQVAGIFEDWPANAHMQPEAFFSSGLSRWSTSTSWSTNPILTYVRLRSAADQGTAEAYLD